jgi:hypothetical protein
MCCFGCYNCKKQIDPRDAPKFAVLSVYVVAAISYEALQDLDIFVLMIVKNLWKVI